MTESTTVELTVNGLPPAKSEARSMLGAGHPHSMRVLALLDAAREVLTTREGFGGEPLGMDVVLSAPEWPPSDATNYLGGIADVLEHKGHRGPLGHLGELAMVGLYVNDRQLAHVTYSFERCETTSYTVSLWALGLWPQTMATAQLRRVELAVYRMKASQTELLKPLLIWLHEPGRELPSDVIGRVISIAESWLVRRQLLRLSLGDMARIVADVIRAHEGTPPAELADSIEAHLSRVNVTSTYWPADKEIREALRTEQVFRRFKKSRLRMLLEAIEDTHRRGTNQPQVPRRGYPIEHILPQKWTEHWPVAGAEAEEARAEHIHRLGNLTLLTRSLNSKVSNGPWASKRAGLQEHDTLLLNSRLLSTLEGPWDEEGIDARTDAMIDVLLAEWPVPQGHEGVVVDPHEKSSGWIQIKHLVDAGLLAPGTVLTPRPGAWESRTALVRPDGLLDVDGKTFESPSGAGRYVKGSITNGWSFWRLPDGWRLRDIRAIYTGKEPAKATPSFDWSALHTILEALPVGHWTTYGALADAVGTAAQPLGQHVATCRQCRNPHRVLRSDGTLAPDFRWSDPEDQRDPMEMLRAEGALVNGMLDPARELSSDDLQGLIEQ